MLRRRDRVLAALMRALIAWLLALGLGMPLLCGAGQHFLLARYALFSGGAALLCALLSLKKRMLPLTLLILAIVSGVLFTQKRGLFYDAYTLARALALLLRGERLALSLYGDLLCLQLAVWLPLLGFALSAPDLVVGQPLTVVSVLLGGEWMLGLRQHSLYMLPVLPALLLIYAFTHSYDAAENEHPAPPSSLLLPIAALLVALALALAPAEGTKAPALARLADDLREMINDRFFFQQERARYTLAADGWMPQGEHRLGGVPEPDESLVMQVKTDENAYLRGAILDTYTGAGWYDTVSSRRYYWNSPRQRALRDEVLQSAYPMAADLPEKQLEVQFDAAGASTLFVPQRLRDLSVGPHMTPYFNLGSEVFITRNLTAGDSYSARYLSMKATDSGMAALAAQHAALDDPGYAAAKAQYTAVPSHMQQEVYDIAYSVTANCTSDWQRATALRDYLQTAYRYTLEVQTPPADVDFVAWFLLAEKQGYCTYFASAMTMLSRIAGLSARYIEGYVARPDASGVAMVRGTSAHAWTEIYLNGLGWVTFDATPGQNDRDDSGSAPPPSWGATPTPAPQEDNAPTPEPSPEPASSPSPEPSSEPQSPNETPSPSSAPDTGNGDANEPPPASPPAKHLPWLWLLLLLLICLLAWRIRVTEPLYRIARMQDDNAALLLLWQAILSCTARLKLPLHHAETPLAYAARAETAFSVPLQKTASAVSALRYGRHNVSSEAVQQARESYLSLHERLNVLQKLTLALRRAVTIRKR